MGTSEKLTRKQRRSALAPYQYRYKTIHTEPGSRWTKTLGLVFLSWVTLAATTARFRDHCFHVSHVAVVMEVDRLRIPPSCSSINGARPTFAWTRVPSCDWKE